MLGPKEKRAIVDQVLALDNDCGVDDASRKTLPTRLIQIDVGRHATLVKSIPRLKRGRVARSKAEATIALQRMRTDPLSMVQIWEDGNVVFWAEFTARQVRVRHYVSGEWQTDLQERSSSLQRV